MEEREIDAELNALIQKVKSKHDAFFSNLFAEAMANVEMEPAKLLDAMMEAVRSLKGEDYGNYPDLAVYFSLRNSVREEDADITITQSLATERSFFLHGLILKGCITLFGGDLKLNDSVPNVNLWLLGLIQWLLVQMLPAINTLSRAIQFGEDPNGTRCKSFATLIVKTTKIAESLLQHVQTNNEGENAWREKLAQLLKHQVNIMLVGDDLVAPVFAAVGAIDHLDSILRYPVSDTKPDQSLVDKALTMYYRIGNNFIGLFERTPPPKSTAGGIKRAHSESKMKEEEASKQRRIEIKKFVLDEEETDDDSEGEVDLPVD